jgi:hypothetical protein
MPDLLLSQKTFRERIVNHFERRYLSQIAGQDGALITWDVVSRKPLTKQQQLMGYALGIYDTSEKVEPKIGHDLRYLNVVFEFHVKISDAETDDVGALLNAVLGEVQRVAGLDIQCSDIYADPPAPAYKLALQTTERGSELDVGSEKPSVAAGVLIIEVQYRTKPNNPFAR